MRFSLIRFAIAGLASLALANSVGAATILQFNQVSPNDVVTETISGGTITLATGLGTVGTPIPASYGNIGGQVPPVTGFETFTLTSTTGLGGFSGTITFTTGATLQLTDVLTNGLLTINGGAATLSSSNSSFTFPAGGAISTQIAAGTGTSAFGSSALSFSNVTFTGTTGGTAQNSGTFSTAVPEPASLVSGGLALLAGLGYFGVRRFKTSRA
jgi:hypothetical protein